MNIEELNAMDPNEFRLRAGRSVQQWAKVLAERLSHDDAWRLLLAGALAVMLPLLGDDGTAATLRELADDLEHGRDPKVVN